MPTFLEFWIIDRNGITLYHQKRNKNVESINKNLFSGFVSAFHDIINVSSQENVESIKFKNSKLIMIPTNVYERLLFIARTDQKEKDKNVRKELNKLSKIFLNEFNEELKKWVGDMDTFETFGKYLIPYW
ncbi:MAG: hypothetical protein JW776_07165 [Candidatus Lokiarchaeota archaeon]|nr:hypothetical protein [Candidatus Lokiarchaeota archaeon]